MSDSYKNQALSRFLEAAHIAEAVRLIRFGITRTAPLGMSEEVHAQRNALQELAARLLEAQIPDLINLGIYEWYRAHDQEAPRPLSAIPVDSGHSGGPESRVQADVSGQG